MSKDPAVLFYTSDFITGTLTMTDEQRGKYIMLLCLQHQQGMLKEEDMLNICKSYDDKIFRKFLKTEDGLYYNERMKNEADRRKMYSESRSRNRKNICSSYEKHMETENENIDIKEEEVKEEKPLTWRDDYNVYLKECKEGYQKFMESSEKIIQQEKLNPGVNVKLSIKKGFVNFWSTEAGWKHKKSKKSKDINWESTIINSITLNKVYYTKKELSEI